MMAIQGVNFKWYDGFFLSMLVMSVIIVSINWKRYHLCEYPLHLWIVVDYTSVFVFRLLMFVDNGLASGMGLDLGWQQKYARFYGRILVLSVLSLLLYPFLWAWTVIGTLWFIHSRNCLPEQGQKLGFLIWLMFSYCGLLCVATISMGKWLTRREAHLQRAQQGIPVSEYGVLCNTFNSVVLPVLGANLIWPSLTVGSFIFGVKHSNKIEHEACHFSSRVLVDMIRVPTWAFEAAGQEMRGMGQDNTAYHPGLYLTAPQREAVEALIQELPKFRLKAVPTDCGECPICLEEFRVGNEVRGLPCAHNFHVECIDEWLRLNVKCPRCRCSVFPNLDLSALANLRADSGRSSASVMTTTTTHYERTQPAGQSYFLRLQGLLRPIRSENSMAGSDVDIDLEATGSASGTHGPSIPAHVADQPSLPPLHQQH